MRRIVVATCAGLALSAWLLIAPPTHAAPATHSATASGSAPASQPAKIQVEGPSTANHIDTYTITSDYQEKPCKLYVLLPDNFDKAKKYKVLYILPVNKAPSASGVIEARKLGLANKYDIICVGPDYSTVPWYGDNPGNPKVRYLSYVPEVIVPFIDKTYPTVAKAEGRMLMGFSKSGIGVLTLLARYPEMFGRAGAWDTPLMLDETKEDWFYGSKEKFLGYYGTEENFKANYILPSLWKENAATLKSQPARVAIVGYGDFKEDTAAAHKLLDELGIPHYYDNAIGREHDWSSGWMETMVTALMSPDMTKAKPAEK
jgi:enterochelin esterase-like enzyme